MTSASASAVCRRLSRYPILLLQNSEWQAAEFASERSESQGGRAKGRQNDHRRQGQEPDLFAISLSSVSRSRRLIRKIQRRPMSYISKWTNWRQNWVPNIWGGTTSGRARTIANALLPAQRTVRACLFLSLMRSYSKIKCLVITEYVESSANFQVAFSVRLNYSFGFRRRRRCQFDGCVLALASVPSLDSLGLTSPRCSIRIGGMPGRKSL